MRKKTLLEYKKKAKIEIKALKKIEKFAISRNYGDLLVKARRMILNRRLWLYELRRDKK